VFLESALAAHHLLRMKYGIEDGITGELVAAGVPKAHSDFARYSEVTAVDPIA